MIAAVVALAILGLGFAGIALVLAIRNGQLGGDNRVLIVDRVRLRTLLEETSEDLAAAHARGEDMEIAHADERRRTYEQIREKYGDAAVGDLAVGDLERLLSAPEGEPDNNPDD